MKRFFSLMIIILLSWMPSPAQVTLLEELFNNPENLPAGWLNIDQDGDGQAWLINTYQTEIYAASASWNSIALTPENYLVTPQLNLQGMSGTLKVRYSICAASKNYYQEHYKLAISTTTPTAQAFTNIIHEETLTSLEANGNWSPREFDISAFLGQNIYITWCHYNCTDMYKLLLDSVYVWYYSNVGMEESSCTPQFHLTPNKFSSSIYITGNIEGGEICLINLAGQVIYRTFSLSSSVTLPATHLPRGIYWVQVKKDGLQGSQKFAW